MTYRTNRTYGSNRIYLDYAASTPVASEVLKAMQPYFSEKYGNPGSLHNFGQEAMAAIDRAREAIAKAVGAPPAGGFREIVFTGSATEANNLALRGIAKAYKTNKSDWSKEPYRIIVSAIEHESVLETARDLEKEGIEIVYLPVNREGFIDLEELKRSLNERTILVSVMYASNEIGTIQPISKISEIVRDFRDNLKFKIHPLFHTDAVQSFQFLDCDANKLGVDLMTLSAHKIYGPKGIGALIRPISPIGPISPISPVTTGGGQEFGLRSGTENVPAIVGFAKAVELAVKNREKEEKRIAELKIYFWQELKKIYPVRNKPPLAVAVMPSAGRISNGVYPNIELNGSLENSLPNILNIYFPGQNSQDFLVKLDIAGVAVSSGAACSARSVKPSHVLQALGFPLARIKNSLRFSFGKFTTEVEIKEVLQRIKKILK